jgi:hypothetical protein
MIATTFVCRSRQLANPAVYLTTAPEAAADVRCPAQCPQPVPILHLAPAVVQPFVTTSLLCILGCSILLSAKSPSCEPCELPPL